MWAPTVAFFVFAICCDGSTVFDRFFSPISKDVHSNNSTEGTLWAFLVAGSNGWINYRHQADVSRAYQLMVTHGIKEENIITMMYDDIAYNSDNPYPGVIINEPDGPNVYKGIKIDYNVSAVTTKNFLAILTGNTSDVVGGNGRVLNTGPNDRIFVYFSDHGSYGAIYILEEALTKLQLSNALLYMSNAKRFDTLVFYLETCYSGSMFDDIASKVKNVYALTASSTDESSYATSCYVDDREVCLGDEFSVNWLRDTEQADTHIRTLQHQYKLVKEETKNSHVKQYGDLNISQVPLEVYQGNDHAHNRDPHNKKLKSTIEYENWATPDVPLKMLETRMRRSSSLSEIQDLKKKINDIHVKREYLDRHMQQFAKRLNLDTTDINLFSNTVKKPITKLQCHNDVVHFFNDNCFTFGANPYTIKYIALLTNLCESDMDAKSIIRELKEQCMHKEYNNIV